MKTFCKFLIILFAIVSCSENEKSVSKAPLPKGKQQVIVDKELGDGKYYKEFLLSVENNDCKAIQDNLDDIVYFGISDIRDTSFIFKRTNGYLEDRNNFSICDLFFNSSIMQKRVSLLLPDNDIIKSLISPREWLTKSKKIRLIAMEKVGEVDIAFFGGRYSNQEEPFNNSRDLDIWFRCPEGFQKKCYLYSYTAY